MTAQAVALAATGEGVWRPLASIRIPLAEPWVLFGDGLFETMRADGGRVRCLDAHVARLARGAERLGMPLPPPDHCIRRLADATSRLPVHSGPWRLRWLLGRSLREGESVRWLLAEPLPASFDRQVGRGLRVVSLQGFGPPPVPALQGLKTLSFLLPRMALREALRQGGQEALRLDAQGRVREAATANVFVVRDGTLWTPPLDGGVLPGVTRTWVLGRARRWGLRVRERALSIDAVQGAEEVFLTSAVRGMAPVVCIDGEPVGSGRPGPLTRRLRRSWLRTR